VGFGLVRQGEVWRGAVWLGKVKEIFPLFKVMVKHYGEKTLGEIHDSISAENQAG